MLLLHSFLAINFLVVVHSFGSEHGEEAVDDEDYFLINIPEAKMTVDQIIRYHGYPVESHNVITKDGYVLNVHRIPASPKYIRMKKATPVFLQHGLMDSSATWVINPPSQSLGFILADHGYDVWMGNSRGNVYSKTHIKFSNDDKKFWDFSFEEMAKYDLPACIDYVRKITNSSKVNYVGHSQGTTIAFIEFSRNQELAKKINKMIALAPVAGLKHIKGAFKYLAKVSTPIKLFLRLMGFKQFLPSNMLTKYLANLVCGNSILDHVCAGFIFLMAGYDTTNLNQTRMAAYLAHTPAGTSIKDVVHFSQNVGHAELRQYDYGFLSNFRRYGQFSPPRYNISSFNVPVALFSGGNDWLATPQDVSQSIRGKIKSIIYDENFPELNHLDFVWGEHANTLIYQNVIKIFDEQ